MLTRIMAAVIAMLATCGGCLANDAVQVGTNGVLKYPTNFKATNDIASAAGLAAEIVARTNSDAALSAAITAASNAALAATAAATGALATAQGIALSIATGAVYQASVDYTTNAVAGLSNSVFGQGWVTASVTNGLASTGYVGQAVAGYVATNAATYTQTVALAASALQSGNTTAELGGWHFEKIMGIPLMWPTVAGASYIEDANQMLVMSLAPGVRTLFMADNTPAISFADGVRIGPDSATNILVYPYLTNLSAQVASKLSTNGSGSALTGITAAQVGAVGTNGGSISYIDLPVPATSAGSPASGIARLESQTVNGQAWINMVQSDGSSFRVLRDTVFSGYNYTGSTLTNGALVSFATGMVSTAHWLQLARADSPSTMPAQGVVIGGNITNGGVGNIAFISRTPTGYLSSALSALPYGTPLFVSTTEAGGYQSTAPGPGYYRQQVGYVNFNGAIDVRIKQSDLVENSAINRAWNLWPGSNSTVAVGAKAMRLVEEGFPDGSTTYWTNSITSNGNYIAFCSPAMGLTQIKSGVYTLNINMGCASASPLPTLRESAEIYLRATNGVETELTAVAGTPDQAVPCDGTFLAYIYTLTLATDVVVNVTDSIEVKLKSSGITTGRTATLVIKSGTFIAPIPSGQFALESEYSAHTTATIAGGVHGGLAAAGYVATNAATYTQTVALAASALQSGNTTAELGGWHFEKIMGIPLMWPTVAGASYIEDANQMLVMSLAPGVRTLFMADNTPAISFADGVRIGPDSATNILVYPYLTNLSAQVASKLSTNGSGSALTGITAAQVGAVGTNGSAIALTNFPASLVSTNATDVTFAGWRLYGSGPAARIVPSGFGSGRLVAPNGVEVLMWTDGTRVLVSTGGVMIAAYTDVLRAYDAAGENGVAVQESITNLNAQMVTALAGAAPSAVRYTAGTNALIGAVQVLASSTGITATVTASTVMFNGSSLSCGLVTFTIPAGVKLLSAQVYWDCTGANTAYNALVVDVGTNDMPNTTAYNRWTPSGLNVFNQSDGSRNASASTALALDTTNLPRFRIGSLSTSTPNLVNVGF